MDGPLILAKRGVEFGVHNGMGSVKGNTVSCQRKESLKEPASLRAVDNLTGLKMSRGYSSARGVVESLGFAVV